MWEDPTGPMVEHERRIGYKYIVEDARKFIEKERPPSSDSSADDYTLFMDDEVKHRIMASEAKRLRDKKSKRDQDVKKRLEDHLKRFRGVGLFKDGIDYRFDASGDLIELKKETNKG